MDAFPSIQFFPYPHPRPGQVELIRAVTHCVKTGQHLCVEAANGLGKTIGVLSGILPFLQRGKFSAIYVARTHKQLDRVMEELRSFSGSLGVTGVIVRGRSASCINPLVTRHFRVRQLIPVICSQLKRIGQCRYYQTLLSRVEVDGSFLRELCEFPLTGMELLQKCRQESVCPYEAARMVMPHAALVATTYHNLFDPENASVFLEAYERPLSRTILILDEAHNLPKIAVELASAKLSIRNIRQAALEAKRYNLMSVHRFGLSLEQVIRNHLRNALSSEISLDPSMFNKEICHLAQVGNLPSFVAEMFDIGQQLTRYFLEVEETPSVSHIQLLAHFFLRWCASINREDVRHFIVSNRANPELVNLELVALDPRLVTLHILDGCWSSIHLSGTLQPIKAHIDLVGLSGEIESCVLPSPFSQNHMLCLISMGVTTALRYRTSGMFRKIAERIAEVCRATPHNVGVFVPSYRVLRALNEVPLDALVDKRIFSELPSLSSSENDMLIQSFKESADEGAVLLGVLGGRNSEGEDYPGWEMESVIIVGVPYAQPGPHEEARINYFEQRFPGKGRIYGYVLPAMRSASQAAGRPVRRLTDKGAIVFLDDRYATPYCRQFLPRWITERMVKLEDRGGVLLQRLSSFFSK